MTEAESFIESLNHKLTRERDVERALVKAVKAAGGEIRKVKWIGRSGAPDRRVMLDWRCVWVELKAPGKYPTPAQAREHARMRKHGETVTVIASMSGVDEFMFDATGGWLIDRRYE